MRRWFRSPTLARAATSGIVVDVKAYDALINFLTGVGVTVGEKMEVFPA